ncbi:hypothetical protein [Trebonia kvetii]|uniref:hypothetical protein n=1 Tax=Trebonia kvetii TaxID=2480626 RepID=UPI001651EDEB|nr:hypothetical protein [Trebonia kvetii]
MVVPLLPEPEETPEDGAMPEDDELDDEDEPEEDELDDLLDEDLLDDDLLDDELAEDAAEDGLEVAFFAVEEVPVLVLVWAFVAAEAWVVCAPTTAAVAVAAVAARAVVQVIFLTRRRPAVLAWTACRKWELVMPTGKPARF